jgi:phosphoribosylanthranilate isomerase
MSILVKICGINSRQAAEAAVAAGADFAGLVFHARSPRLVSLDEARSLADYLHDHVRVVALVADADDETIAAVVSAVRPDFIQLHGNESADRVGAVRARFKVHVIKALPVADESDFARLPDFMQVSDMMLFDARPPAGAALPGGNGAAFDWKLLRGRAYSRPWLLAGGLNEANLAAAVALSGAKFVDVSSGVENAPGVKDPIKIAAFVAAARNLNS